MQPFQRQLRQKITHANRAADPDPEPVSMRPSKALGSAPLALGLLCLVSVTSSALAQRARGEWRMSCRDHEDDDWGETYCDIKEQTLRPGTGPIRVDAHPNGGVAVVGWDKNEILLRSKITAHARSEEDARALARARAGHPDYERGRPSLGPRALLRYPRDRDGQRWPGGGVSGASAGTPDSPDHHPVGRRRSDHPRAHHQRRGGGPAALNGGGGWGVGGGRPPPLSPRRTSGTTRPPSL